MLEWFHQLHEVLDALVTDEQTRTLSDDFSNSYLLSEELDLAFSFGSQFWKNKQ